MPTCQTTLHTPLAKNRCTSARLLAGTCCFRRRFMFNVPGYFLLNSTTLKPNYQSEWNAVVPHFRRLLDQGKLLGFSPGDEIMGQGRASLSVVKTICDTVRASFTREEAIIWWNEGNVQISTGETFPLPDSVDCESLRLLLLLARLLTLQAAASARRRQAKVRLARAWGCHSISNPPWLCVYTFHV